VTRDSVIRLCQSWGLKVSERRLTIDEVIAAQKSGQLKEAFGTGTAAVVSPVADISYQGGDYQVADGKTGPLAHRL
jgi:branched-chain amino acid aminotransferase